MFPSIFAISWVGVLVSTVALTIVGGLWFTVIFGKVYAVALGRGGQAASKPAPLMILGPLVCSFVTSIAMAVLVQALHLETLGDGLAFGVLVGLGLLVPTCVNTAINPNMPRPLFYGLISGSYFFVSGILMSVIVVLL